jgi:hypothetical protein
VLAVPSEQVVHAVDGRNRHVQGVHSRFCGQAAIGHEARSQLNDVVSDSQQGNSVQRIKAPT